MLTGNGTVGTHKAVCIAGEDIILYSPGNSVFIPSARYGVLITRDRSGHCGTALQIVKNLCQVSPGNLSVRPENGGGIPVHDFAFVNV